MFPCTDRKKPKKDLGENIEIDKIIKLGPNYALQQTKITVNRFWIVVHVFNPGEKFVYILVTIMLPKYMYIVV